MFPPHFSFSQTSTGVFITRWKHGTCFLFLSVHVLYFFYRIHRDEERKTTCQLGLSKYKFSLLLPSLGQQLVLVLCLHRVKETRFLTNQRAYFLRTVFFIQYTKQGLISISRIPYGRKDMMILIVMMITMIICAISLN